MAHRHIPCGEANDSDFGSFVEALCDDGDRLERALASTDALLRKAVAQLYLCGDAELSDQLRARLNANAQALREGRAA